MRQQTYKMGQNFNTKYNMIGLWESSISLFLRKGGKGYGNNCKCVSIIQSKIQTVNVESWGIYANGNIKG